MYKHTSINIPLLFSGLIVSNDSHLAHSQVVAHLRAQGWACQREYSVADRGDGHPGAIDILAAKQGVLLAIEIDRKSPRQKSIVKLRRVSADYRVVLLRGGRRSQKVDDIHIVSLGVNYARS